LDPAGTARPIEPNDAAWAALVMRQVASCYGLPLEKLQGAQRHRPLPEARHLAMLIIRESTCLSLPQIGRIFDRDHTTVLVGIRQARRRLARSVSPAQPFLDDLELELVSRLPDVHTSPAEASS